MDNMQDKLRSAFDVLNRDLEKYKKITSNPIMELASKEQEHITLSQKIKDLANSPIMKAYYAFNRIESISKAYEEFQKSVCLLKQLSEPYIKKYAELSSQFKAIHDLANLKVNETYSAFSNLSSSIKSATEAMQVNFFTINTSLNLTEYLKPFAFRPSFELQSFIESSNRLAKKWTKDSSKIDVTNASLNLATSESVESANFVVNTSDLLSIQEDELFDISVTLPTFNLYSFQRKEIFWLAQSNPVGFSNPENIDTLPSYIYYKTAKSCGHLITRCNQKCGALGKDYIFKPTNKLMIALMAISDLIAPNELIFGEFIDQLYILLYEGVGDDNLRVKNYLSDDELLPIWDIKQLRNYYFRHDVEHGNTDNAKKKMQKIGEIFHRIIKKPLPENGKDFRNAQITIIANVLKMLELLYIRMENLNAT